MARCCLRLKARCLVPVLLTAGLAACATEKQTFPPPSAEIREQLGSAQVVMGGTATTSSPVDPLSGIGSAAAEGALGGAAAGATPILLCHPELIIGTLGVSCLIGLPLAAVTTPVGAAIGAGVGAGVAHTEEEVEEASDSLSRALAESTLNEDLFAHLRAAGAGHRVANIARAEGMAAASLRRGEALDPVQPDGLLEIGVSHVRFESSGEWDPDLSMRISARAHLVRGHDQRVLYRRAWEYRSPWEDYFDMAEDDARLLRTMIDTGLRQLAEAIVTTLFVDIDPEVHDLGPIPVGEVWTTWAQAPPPVVTAPAPVVTPSAPSVPTPAAEAAAIPTAGVSFGAIAIATTAHFRSGACVNQPTEALAQACAIRECGSFCEIRAVFGNGQCAAIAGTRRRSRPEDIVVSSSSTAAREAAVSQCRSHPRSVSFSSARCELMAPTICNLAPETAAPAQEAPPGPGGVPEAQAMPTPATEPGSAAVASVEPQHFGAIAVSTTSTFRSGACVNEPTPAAAESCALRECGRHCEVHVAFGAGQCAMIAGKRPYQGVRDDSPHNRWRVGAPGVGASPAAARQSAIAECQRNNRNCAELVRPVCNG